MPPTVLHLAPHPDDEVLGAGPTLTLLRDAGCRVVNLACGLGRPEQWERRRRELDLAVDRLGIELVVCDPPLALSGRDDLAASEVRLVHELRRLRAEVGFDLVVGPQEQDGHHGHDVVGRATRRWIDEDRAPVTWWAWGLWADLAAPTLLVPFDDARLEEVRHALEAHVGEVERNDYLRLLEARGVVGAVLGPEKVFGFGGEQPSGLPYADVLRERSLVPGSGFVDGAPRVWSGDGADVRPGRAA